ncbi:hypothetical protein AVEN_200800-1 [Araneus ventricosus]|uniref:Uncharacterized protein n=1 Tax=Araneus ventricosus TaxID=182803 RepID=A0A4Y2WRA9_ARAVE|nr:hypothetical protein AVEN_200800-1 [Araneus ventricosus]
MILDLLTRFPCPHTSPAQLQHLLCDCHIFGKKYLNRVKGSAVTRVVQVTGENWIRLQRRVPTVRKPSTPVHKCREGMLQDQSLINGNYV